MTDAPSPPAVHDDPDRRRLTVTVDGAEAELVYTLDPGRMTLVHTGVPPELEGRGIGAALVRAALAKAEADGRTVVPRCPYARHWLEAHPDAASRVSVDWDTVPQGRPRD